MAQRLGIRVLHETHRGRFAFHTASLLPYLHRFPQLRLTADFSHWCTVSESLLSDQQGLLNQIIPRFTALQVYQAILESIASEHAARMTAMDNATNACKDMIKQLTMLYNKARQAAVTGELMDIVGGAEALKG